MTNPAETDDPALTLRARRGCARGLNIVFYAGRDIVNVVELIFTNPQYEIGGFRIMMVM